MKSIQQLYLVLGAALFVTACRSEPDPEVLSIARESAVTQYIAESADRAAHNKKIASAFFAEGVTEEDRYALLHDGYIQHNPIFKKFALENGVSDKEAFKKLRMQPGGRGGAAAGGPAQEGPRPPRGNPLFMVLAEGDLVFIMRQQYRQDPSKAPGEFYEAFAWDTFRIKDDKLYEHWDGAVLPAPAGNQQRPGAPTF